MRSSYHHGDLRTALVETGLELTRAGGPDALRLREATRRTGVTARAAYRHFADRDALLAAVAARIQDKMARSMRERMDDGESDDSVDRATARLREALDALVGSGLLSAERRSGAEWSCWSTVHGFAELAIHGPLQGQGPSDLRLIASQAVDDVIAGIRRGAGTA